MDLQLNPITNDAYLQSGDLAVTVLQSDAITQLLKQNLQFFLGEWFLDQSLGIPYIQSIFTKNPSPLIIDAALKKAILIDTPGVMQLLSFSAQIDSSTRALQVTGQIQVTGDSNVVDFNVSIGA